MSTTKRGFNIRFWLVVGATFLGFLGIGTVLPALAPYVRFRLGGSDQTVGWVIGTFSFVALVSRLFSGPLADRRGRKITFLTGLFSCALAGGAYFLPFGLASAYLGRILQGFGEACLYTGAAVWAVELAGVERSSQALGFLSSAVWGGISAGPAIGHWLGSFEHAAVFQTAAALCAFITAFFVKESFEPHRRAKRSLAVSASLIAPGLAIGFVNVHYPVIAGFLILHLTSHGHSGPAAFSTYAGVILLSRFFLGSLPDRIHPSITFYSGLCFMAVGLTLIALAPSPSIAIMAAGILGFGFSFPWASIAATVIRATPQSEHGRAVGFLSAFYDLFVGISSFASGAVADRWGYAAAFGMAALALIAAAVAAYWVFFTQRLAPYDASEERALEAALS